MTTKRKYRKDDTNRSKGPLESIGEIAVAIIAVVFFAVMYIVILIIKFVLAYWYLFAVLAVIAGYLWLRYHKPDQTAIIQYQQSVPQCITTMERTNTASGYRIVRTKFNDPPKPKPSPGLFDRVAGLFR
jgi:hypothetical protein